MTTPARVRMPLADFLDCADVGLCDTILRRALGRVPLLVGKQLGHEPGAAAETSAGHAIWRSVIGNNNLNLSDGEPAINVYRVGGCFKPHEDKMALTVLVPLSDAASGAFEGGGTAFWSTEDPGSLRCANGGHIASSQAPSVPPTLIVQAAAGTALVFTGTVTHAALAVVAGERTILVASFSNSCRTADPLAHAMPGLMAGLEGLLP